MMLTITSSSINCLQHYLVVNITQLCPVRIPVSSTGDFMFNQCDGKVCYVVSLIMVRNHLNHASQKPRIRIVNILIQCSGPSPAAPPIASRASVCGCRFGWMVDLSAPACLGMGYVSRPNSKMDLLYFTSAYIYLIVQCP